MHPKGTVYTTYRQWACCSIVLKRSSRRTQICAHFIDNVVASHLWIRDMIVLVICRDSEQAKMHRSALRDIEDGQCCIRVYDAILPQTLQRFRCAYEL